MDFVGYNYCEYRRSLRVFIPVVIWFEHQPRWWPLMSLSNISCGTLAVVLVLRIRVCIWQWFIQNVKLKTNHARPKKIATLQPGYWAGGATSGPECLHRWP